MELRSGRMKHEERRRRRVNNNNTAATDDDISSSAAVRTSSSARSSTSFPSSSTTSSPTSSLPPVPDSPRHEDLTTSSSEAADADDTDTDSTASNESAAPAGIFSRFLWWLPIGAVLILIGAGLFNRQLLPQSTHPLAPPCHVRNNPNRLVPCTLIHDVTRLLAPLSSQLPDAVSSQWFKHVDHPPGLQSVSSRVSASYAAVIDQKVHSLWVTYDVLSTFPRHRGPAQNAETLEDLRQVLLEDWDDVQAPYFAGRFRRAWPCSDHSSPTTYWMCFLPFNPWISQDYRTALLRELQHAYHSKYLSPLLRGSEQEFYYALDYQRRIESFLDDFYSCLEEISNALDISGNDNDEIEAAVPQLAPLHSMETWAVFVWLAMTTQTLRLRVANRLLVAYYQMDDATTQSSLHTASPPPSMAALWSRLPHDIDAALARSLRNTTNRAIRALSLKYFLNCFSRDSYLHTGSGTLHNATQLPRPPYHSDNDGTGCPSHPAPFLRLWWTRGDTSGVLMDDVPEWPSVLDRRRRWHRRSDGSSRARRYKLRDELDWLEAMQSDIVSATDNGQMEGIFEANSSWES